MLKFIVFLLLAGSCYAQVAEVRLPRSKGAPYCLVEKDGTERWVPQDPANSDFHRIVEWIMSGHAPLPAESSITAQSSAQVAELQKQLKTLQAEHAKVKAILSSVRASLVSTK